MNAPQQMSVDELAEQLALRASRKCADGYAVPFDSDLDQAAASALSSQSLSLSEAREDRDSWRRVAERCESEKQAGQATIKRMDRAASEANALYLKMSAERDAAREEIERLKRERDAALEALRPFGALADSYFHRYETRPGVFRESHQDDPDDRAVYGINRVEITTGHFRRARSVLASRKSEGV